MNVTTHGEQPEGPKPPVGFEAHVTVNGKPVLLREHRMTGLQIKEAAIQQGVRIELNFILQEELANGQSRIIGNDDPVEVHNHLRFTAIPNDDHS